MRGLRSAAWKESRRFLNTPRVVAVPLSLDALVNDGPVDVGMETVDFCLLFACVADLRLGMYVCDCFRTEGRRRDAGKEIASKQKLGGDDPLFQPEEWQGLQNDKYTRVAVEELVAAAARQCGMRIVAIESPE